MNAVIIAVLVMLILSLLRVNVVFALLIGALAGGLSGGLSFTETLTSYTDGLGAGATIALSYAMLGGFAVAISRTGIPELLVAGVLKLVNKDGEATRENLAKALIIFALFAMAIFSQNLIPIHIAFIPLLVPPILHILNELRIDRRLIASVLTFGLTAPYILLPYGFGLIFHEILATQMELAGMPIDMADIPKAMALPVAGLFLGLVVAVFISYRKPRDYRTVEAANTIEETPKRTASVKDIIVTVIALIAALFAQIQSDSMIIGALAGILILYIFGAMKWKEADDVLTAGMRMMAFIGFVMISANGFASVIQATGAIDSLVENAASIFGDNKGLAALAMLIVGLFVTMGIGSSFSTIPIIAAIFVPLSVEFGFSTMAIIALIGTAGALGDAGSPASDSTLGPTAGLNVDGQHNHIWDTVVPTFIHYNIPLVLFGWIAVMFLG
ncbi:MULTISPECIES: Na+/H+ antiporter family protein [unclassified Planococcus (in: firmicutes)]|uniref:Na+/H+ antiporter family protein n=1 Tax=Planococcus TaxID=1372 RepID=UPI000C33C769|nr:MULTISPECIES: Na+/H+ antiporter family protein [unclassified Planococcus (in: firmicutes)]AUD12616.1 sodium:proton antiporter [Planococcus sp. MB-3u-03]PKG44548.1 sodium:proton antiporter [Planococcus sp. Urea-trap-24]PKG91369.1 sodium:proton antiporter [Planococcus sp. Urea-3u-39]PKH35991.1 sodium:proton antiporter [Planococcus sp. MB-3u-09]